MVEYSVMLTGLLDGTGYHFRAVSSDGYRMVAVTADSAFSTLELEPTGPQVIVAVRALTECVNSVVATRSTDRPATSQVRYGTKGTLDRATEVDTTHVTEHLVRVRPVAQKHEYTFTVLSAYWSDTAESTEFTFATVLPGASTNSGKEVTITRPGVVCVAESTATIARSTGHPCTT